MDGVERVILDGWDSDDWMVVDMGHMPTGGKEATAGTGETVDTWK